LLMRMELFGLPVLGKDVDELGLLILCWLPALVIWLAKLRDEYKPRSSEPATASTGHSVVTVYWPLLLALFTVSLGAFFDPMQPLDVWPPPLDVSRAPQLLFHPLFILCAIMSASGLFLARQIAIEHSITAYEHFAMVWWTLNVTWFQMGCDVFSGLFAVMPNLSECYLVLNANHKLPTFHEKRVVMDCVYLLELLVQVPCAVVTFALYMRRSPCRYVVEAFTCGMHVAAMVAFYIPDLIMGESTSFVTHLDRAIACCWIVVPFGLLVRAVQLSDTTSARGTEE